jgi:hypothetical protein
MVALSLQTNKEATIWNFIVDSKQKLLFLWNNTAKKIVLWDVTPCSLVQVYGTVEDKVGEWMNTA